MHENHPCILNMYAMMYTGKLGLMYIWHRNWALISKYTRNFLLCILPDKCICKHFVVLAWNWASTNWNTKKKSVHFQNLFNLSLPWQPKLIHVIMTDFCLNRVLCKHYCLPPFQLWRPCRWETLHVSKSPDHRVVAQQLFRRGEGEFCWRAVHNYLG